MAVRIDEHGRILSHREAEFHEKGGVFTDTSGNKVFFDGSVNNQTGLAKKSGENFSIHKLVGHY